MTELMRPPPPWEAAIAKGEREDSERHAGEFMVWEKERHTPRASRFPPPNRPMAIAMSASY
jgi:hypothetical protein